MNAYEYENNFSFLLTFFRIKHHKSALKGDLPFNGDFFSSSFLHTIPKDFLSDLEVMRLFHSLRSERTQAALEADKGNSDRGSNDFKKEESIVIVTNTDNSKCEESSKRQQRWRKTSVLLTEAKVGSSDGDRNSCCDGRKGQPYCRNPNATIFDKAYDVGCNTTIAIFF